MSTPLDRTVLANYLDNLHLSREERVLYVGSRDPVALSVVTRRFDKVDTLDCDPSLNPTYLLDLNGLSRRGRMHTLRDPDTYASLPPEKTYGTVVIPYVLMYLDDPLGVLDIITKRVCPRILVQENVIRRRGSSDPWPDVNRFICGSRGTYRIATEKAAREGRKRLVEFPFASVKDVTYYTNGDGVSALWVLG